MRTLFLPIIALSASLAAQGVEIYSSGPLVTHPGGGTAGADLSGLQVQVTTPFFMNVLGHRINSALGDRIVEDFATNGAWLIDGFEFFCYQTSQLTPSITSAFAQIFDGDPSMGGVPVLVPGFDGVTDLFADPGFTASNTMANINRASLAAPTSAARPIQSVRIDFATSFLLDPSQTGTNVYWIEFAAAGSSTSGPWMPPVTILGSPNTGVAYQKLGTAYNPLADGGNPVQPVPYNSAAPFKFYGTPILPDGTFTNLGGGSGTAVLEVRGAPHVGGVVHVDMTNTDPLRIQLNWLGLSDANLPLIV